MNILLIERPVPELKKLFGWGNGYVILPKEHPFYGQHYMEINRLCPEIQVHGGLTFSGPVRHLRLETKQYLPKDSWAVGFDTMHLGDTIEKWPKHKVMEEAIKLRKQLVVFGMKLGA